MVKGKFVFWNEGEKVGEISLSNNQIDFSGNATESAKILIEELRKHHNNLKSSNGALPCPFCGSRSINTHAVDTCGEPSYQCNECGSLAFDDIWNLRS